MIHEMNFCYAFHEQCLFLFLLVVLVLVRSWVRKLKQGGAMMEGPTESRATRPEGILFGGEKSGRFWQCA
jgi:hypothetical protein